MKHYFFLTLAALIFIGQSCKKNTLDEALDLGKEFLPLKVDNSWTYQMDSVIFHGTGAPPDTFNYQVRHSVVEDVIVNEDIREYLIEIESRADTGESWDYARSYKVRFDNGEVVKIDKDVSEIILNLPLLEFKNWNGNLYNNLEESIYYVSEIDQEKDINGMSFERTVTIEQEEQDNLVNLYRGSECYAWNVGLVHKEIEHLSNLINEDKIVGVKYTLTLISFEI